MKYDLIIACGDSFTEGCLGVLELPPGDCWPGRVAKHFDIPFINFAVGGASNTAISLQPIQSLTPERVELIKSSKNPLMLFNFTKHERLPAFTSKMHTQLESFYSILPEHVLHWDPELGSAYNSIIAKCLLKKIPYVPVKFSGDNYWHNKEVPSSYLPFFVSLTMEAIRNAMSLQYLNPNITCRWGYIHFDAETLYPDLEHIANPTPDIEIIEFKHPYRNLCYNKEFNMMPLQPLINNNHISDTDTHPNSKGIQLLANWFIEYIKTLE